LIALEHDFKIVLTAKNTIENTFVYKKQTAVASRDGKYRCTSDLFTANTSAIF